MPEIIGQFNSSTSNIPPLDAHIAHLRHLTNPRIGRNLLRARFRFSASAARETAKLVAAHVGQSLEFHDQSRLVSAAIRPVLQYYCYLNLAVAAILAFRPTNFNQYGHHGVKDRTRNLSSLDLSSLVVEVNRGAVPVFHSIMSDVALNGKKFRLGQLAAGFQMVSDELKRNFGKTTQVILVVDQLKEVSGVWHSEFAFQLLALGEVQKIGVNRLEKAMPLLSSDYRLQPNSGDSRVYQSNSSWTTESAARLAHKANGLKLINFGGHQIISSDVVPTRCAYLWHGVSRVALLPTLSSILLMAFCLASIARYRPILLQQVMASPVQLLLDTFVQEADGVYIPALRNLLYRQESVIGPPEYM